MVKQTPVVPNLYFGDQRDALTKMNSFDEIVSIGAAGHYTTQNFEIVDDTSHDYNTFKVVELVSKDKKVLVHYNAGVSRSVSVVAASYAILDENTETFHEALQIIQVGHIRPHYSLIDSGEKVVQEITS